MLSSPKQPIQYVSYARAIVDRIFGTISDTWERGFGMSYNDTRNDNHRIWSKVDDIT